MSVTLKVRRKDELFQKLRASVPAVEKGLRDAAAQSATEMVALAKSFAPVDPNNPGDLKGSIGWRWGMTQENRTSAAGTTSLADGSIRATVFATAFYGRWVEFGTAARDGHPGTSPQPFFFPAYRLIAKKARSRFSRAMTKAIKAVAR